ncbi:hypothetical protein ACT79_06990 [Burkholderia pseudomallei]|nr:hypothetical protein ACT79_06990 [Burkholderia pseudomallei]
MYRHFLVPVDDTDAGIDTVAYAVEFARSIGARITFVQTRIEFEAADAARRIGETERKEQTQRTDDAGKSGECGQIQDESVRPAPTPDAAARPAAEATPAARAPELPIAKAEAAARAQGVPCDSVRAAGATTADALAGAMLAHDCDLLCVGPALGDAAAAPPHACVADRLAARGIAVLTCAFRRTPAAARAIAALYAAHREAAGALGAWLAQLRAAIAAGRALDADAAHAIANGPEPSRDGRQPKAARRLYAALRGATGALDAELGELERQRLRNARMLSGLLEAIHAGIAREAPPVRLEHALSAYAQCVCEHAGRGEGVIVPAAQRYLADDDWRAIDASLALIASGPAAATRGA